MTIREQLKKNAPVDGQSYDVVQEIDNAQRMGEIGLYFQLMEECAELTQACAKASRLRGFGQPLSDELSESDIEYNLLEEMADVSLVIDEILIVKAKGTYDPHSDEWALYKRYNKLIRDIQSRKLKRTAERYKEADDNGNT